MIDLWEDVLVTHRAAVDRLPASIRSDFLPPGPFAALREWGITLADLERVRFVKGGVI